MSYVPKELLSSAILKLKNVSLYDTGLSTEQVIAVLETVVKSNSLVNLNLSKNVLRYVPKELLTSAIIKLKEVSLDNSNTSDNELFICRTEKYVHNNKIKI